MTGTFIDGTFCDGFFIDGSFSHGSLCKCIAVILAIADVPALAGFPSCCWLLSFANASATVGISDVADIPAVDIASLLFLGAPIASSLFLVSLPLIGGFAAVGGLVDVVGLPAVAVVPTALSPYQCYHPCFSIVPAVSHLFFCFGCPCCCSNAHACVPYTDKKENQSFLIHKEIQSGAVAIYD